MGPQALLALRSTCCGRNALTRSLRSLPGSPVRRRCVFLGHSLLQTKATEAHVFCAGKELAVWRDAEGEWRCFEDKCPHRRGT